MTEEYGVSDINSDLLTQEVDDEVRRERMRMLWNAYGKYLIGLAVGVVIFVGGNVGYEAYVRSGEEASSTEFERAREASVEDSANATQIWEDSLPSLKGGYKSIGRLRGAAAAAENGQVIEAIALYDAIAADTSADDSMRDLARLFAGMLVAREGENLADARTRLSVVAIKGNPWYFSGLEQMALIDLELGDQESALSGFTQLVDDSATPQPIRVRATELKAALQKAMGLDPLTGLPLNAEQQDAPLGQDNSNETGDSQ
jgi:hypothetical protein